MDKIHTTVVLVDLQEVFETLDHNVILQELKCIAFKESHQHFHA